MSSVDTYVSNKEFFLFDVTCDFVQEDSVSKGESGDRNLVDGKLGDDRTLVYLFLEVLTSNVCWLNFETYFLIL